MRADSRPSLPEINVLLAATNAATKAGVARRKARAAKHPTASTQRTAPPHARGPVSLLQQYASLKGQERFLFYVQNASKLWAQFLAGAV